MSPGGGWTNEVVAITGTFTIDVATFSITDCIVQMAPGATILVNNSNELNVDKSFLFSCNEMWEGIRVLSFGLLTITDSRIEDAQYAIYANSATGVKVLNNTFERNWVVARLVQKTANPAATHVFRGNLFFGNVLKPPFSGQAPLPETHSFAGIWASSIPYVWLGDGSNSPNTALNRFVDLRIGIISNRSVFSISRTSFETIIDDGVVQGYQTGIGIFAESSSYIHQVGMGKTGYPAFVGCMYASIHLKQSTAVSRESYYARLGKYGVYAISPKDHYIRIYNNRFDNTNTGILTINAVYAERSATGDDKINDNYIYSSTISGASLIALNDMVGGTGEAEILRDTIASIGGQISGIELRPGTGTNFRVSNNIIQADDLFWGLTIYGAATASSNIVVSDNTVEVFNNATFSAYLFQAQNTLFCNNTLLGNGASQCALGVRNIASGAKLGLNEIQDSQRGFLFLNSGINMGIQSHLGNTWQNGFPVWAAQHLASDFNMSQFEINTDLLNCGSTLYLPNDLGTVSVFPLTGWFIDVPNECVEDCTELYDDLKMGDVYRATANQEGPELGWNTAAEWAANAYLYYQMELGNETGLTMEQISNFIQIVDQTEIPAIQNHQTQIRAALQGTTTEVTTAKIAHANFALAVSNKTASLQSWLDNGAEAWAIENETWDEAWTQHQLFLENRSVQQSEDLQVVMEQLVPQGDLLEEQWYTVNRLLVKETITGELSGEDWAVLENLAIQCYDTHGSAVFIAQSMLPACRWREYHELSLLACETAEIQIPNPAIEESISSILSMSLYPNPASNLVRVDIHELEPGAVPGELVLKNAYGQVVLRQPTFENIIDLQQLAPGIYILEWWSGNHRLSTEKLIKS